MCMNVHTPCACLCMQVHIHMLACDCEGQRAVGGGHFTGGVHVAFETRSVIET